MQIQGENNMINLFPMKKKLKSMLAVTAASMMLCTGCVRSGVGVVIESNDTGTVEISVGINEKYIDTITEQTGGMNPFGGKNTAALTDGENSYICITERKQFSNLDELKTILLELEYNFDALEGEDSSETNETESADEHEIDVWINADGEEIFFEDDEPSDDALEENYRIFKNAEVTHESGLWGDTYRFSVTTMPHEMDTDDLALLGISADSMFKLVVTVTMPGTMASEEAEINENTASFTITDLEKEHVLTAESSTTNVAGIIAIVIAAIILIAVLILVFFRRKPRHNQAFE